MWLGITNEFMHLFNIVKYFKEQEIMCKLFKKGFLANGDPVRKMEVNVKGEQEY